MATNDSPDSATVPPPPPPKDSSNEFVLSTPTNIQTSPVVGSPSQQVHVPQSLNMTGSPRPLNTMGRAIFPGGARSISLSPSHLMGNSSRRRIIAPPSASLLVPRPNMPFLNDPSLSSESPVRFSEHQRAMEQAVAAERKRAKEMEEHEKDLSADELRQILKQERHRMAGFARTIADLRCTAVSCQSAAEIHEEGRINSLLGRLETMQMEKGRIVNELEREEEMITNTLQKKLDQVRREKLELEKLIQHEQRSHSDMQSKLTGIRACADTTADVGVDRANTGSLLESLDEGDDEEEEDTVLDAVLPDLAAMNEHL